MKQHEAITVMLAACPHPALSSLFPWPEGPTGLAPSSAPALSAAVLAGTDSDPEQPDNLGLNEHPSCRANPFCTHQMDTELFRKPGWTSPVRSKESCELCFPPRAMGLISRWYLELRDLSGKWGMPWVVSHTSLCSHPYSWTMSLKCLRIHGNTRLDMVSNTPSCAWSPWLLFFMVIIFSLFLCWDHKNTRLSILACLCFPSSAKQFASWAWKPGFSLTLFWSPNETAPSVKTFQRWMGLSAGHIILAGLTA